jgi:hypothetical protein
MAKRSYGLVYAGLIIIGILFVVVYDWLSSSGAEQPKAQATLQQATAQQGQAVAVEANAEREEKPAPDAGGETTAAASRTEQPATAKDEEAK